MGCPPCSHKSQAISVCWPQSHMHSHDNLHEDSMSCSDVWALDSYQRIANAASKYGAGRKLCKLCARWVAGWRHWEVGRFVHLGL